MYIVQGDDVQRLQSTNRYCGETMAREAIKYTRKTMPRKMMKYTE